MTIPVQCPACQHAFAVAEHYLGKRGKCPQCGMIFKAEAQPPEEDVPTFEDVSAAAGVPPVPMPKRLAALTAKAPPRQVPPVPPPVMDAIPVTTTPEPPAFPPLNIPSVALSASKSPEDTPAALQKKPARSNLLLMLVGAGGGTLLAIATGVAAMYILSAPPGETVVVNPGSETKSKNAPPIPVEKKKTDVPPLDTAPLEPLRDSVLPLEITTPQGQRQANCVVVDSRGWAVTNLHLLRQATQVEAIGAAGIRIPVPGTLAIDPAHDLAIIKLDPNVPLTFSKLELAARETAARTPVAAFDTASSAVTPIVVGQVKSNSTLVKLAPATRSLVQRIDTPWADDTQLMLHDLALPEASSGTPLLSAEGQIVALQLLSSEVSGGMALHAQHVAALLAKTGGEVQPWATLEVAAAEAVPFNTPDEAPAEPSTTPAEDRLPVIPAVRPLGDPLDDLVARMNEHRAECVKLKWQPSDAREYAQFQLLAQFVTEAAQLADAPEAPPAGKAKLETAITQTLAALPAEDFPADAAWQVTGKLAEKALQAAPGEGFFALATVLVPTSDGQMIDGQPVAVLEVAGTSQLIVVATKLDGDKFKADARFVVLGRHDPTLRVNIGDRRAAMIRSKYTLLVEKP